MFFWDTRDGKEQGKGPYSLLARNFLCQTFYCWSIVGFQCIFGLSTMSLNFSLVKNFKQFALYNQDPWLSGYPPPHTQTGFSWSSKVGASLRGRKADFRQGWLSSSGLSYRSQEGNFHWNSYKPIFYQNFSINLKMNPCILEFLKGFESYCPFTLPYLYCNSNCGGKTSIWNPTTGTHSLCHAWLSSQVYFGTLFLSNGVYWWHMPTFFEVLHP